MNFRPYSQQNTRILTDNVKQEHVEGAIEDWVKNSNGFDVVNKDWYLGVTELQRFQDSSRYWLLHNNQFYPAKHIGHLAQVRAGISLGSRLNNFHTYDYTYLLHNLGFNVVDTLEEVKSKDQVERAAREPKYYSVLARPEQLRFRDAVIQNCGNACVITGCTVIESLEAAHVTPWSENKDDDPSNGLLLRRDVHRLFDLHLISIDPDTSKISISNSIQCHYREFEDRRATIPNQLNFNNLKEHFRRFKENQG